MCRALKTLSWDEKDAPMIDVIISYRSSLSDDDAEDKGLLYCEGLAHELKQSGYNPFHGDTLHFTLRWSYLLD
jgi:hypothetical protein